MTASHVRRRESPRETGPERTAGAGAVIRFTVGKCSLGQIWSRGAGRASAPFFSATVQRPVSGTRGAYRVNLKHGASRVRSGRRYTLGA